VGLWQDADKLEIAIRRIIHIAKQFNNGCLELHSPGLTWQKFKDVLTTGFVTPTPISATSWGYKQPDSPGNESIKESADRCSALAQEIVCKVEDPLAQRIYFQNADRILLACFAAGIRGRQVRFSNPHDLDQALRTALSVQEGEKQDRFNKSFYTSFDNSLRIRSRSPTRHVDHRSQPQLTRSMRQLKREVIVTRPHVATSQNLRK
jgi:hypothetical protein